MVRMPAQTPAEAPQRAFFTPSAKYPAAAQHRPYASSDVNAAGAAAVTARRAPEEEVQALGADLAEGDGLGSRGWMTPHCGGDQRRDETTPPARAAYGSS